MILVDTSVWVDHLRRSGAGLAALLERAVVLMHPFVIGELACGTLADRASLLELLGALPGAVVAEHDEVLAFTEHHGLHGRGIGWIDMHLLAAVALTPGARLWTRDKRLAGVAAGLGCAYLDAASH